VDSISQALSYKPPSFWTKECAENYNHAMTRLWKEEMFARLAGRPW
jgi:hypothetical protein